MVNLIPELALIIGEQPPVADLSAAEAQNRFQLVFRQFLGVFARRGASAGAVPRRSAMAGRGDARAARASGHAPGGAPPAAGRRLPRQRGRPRASADARGSTTIRRAEAQGAGDRAGAARARRCRPAHRRCACIAIPEHAWPLAAAGASRRPAAIRSSRSSSSRALAEEDCSRSTPTAPRWRWDIERIRARGYHRQRGGSDGRQAEPASRSHAGRR